MALLITSLAAGVSVAIVQHVCIMMKIAVRVLINTRWLTTLTRTVSIMVYQTSASFLLEKLNNYQKAINIGLLANNNTVATVNFLGVVSPGANIGRAKTRPTRPFATALHPVPSYNDVGALRQQALRTIPDVG